MTVRGRRHILYRRLNKKTRFLLAGVVLLLLLGGAAFALRNPSGLAVEIEDGPPHVTTPWDQETVPFFLEEDQGQCTFTLEQLQETFGKDVSFTFDNCPSLGNDIDTYLLNSFRMAALVNSRGRNPPKTSMPPSILTKRGTTCVFCSSMTAPPTSWATSSACPRRKRTAAGGWM